MSIDQNSKFKEGDLEGQNVSAENIGHKDDHHKAQPHTSVDSNMTDKDIQSKGGDINPGGGSMANNTHKESHDTNQPLISFEYKWYVLQVPSNAERSLEAQIWQKIKEEKKHKYFEEIFIPCYTTTVIRRGKKEEVERRIMPGYIFIKMYITPISSSLVKSIKNVRFLGAHPLRDVREIRAITEQEMNIIKQNAILEANTEEVNPYNIGEDIEVISGAFAGFKGKVKSLDIEKQKVQIALQVFGRETPVNLELDSIKKG